MIALRNKGLRGALALGMAVVPQAHACFAQAVAEEAADIDPGRLAIAKDIVAIAYPVEIREQIFNGAMDAMLVQMRGTMFASLKNDPGAEHIVSSHVDRFVVKGKAILKGHIPAMMDALADAYSREFTASELTELRAFASTPAGSHFLQRSSAVLSDPSFRAANESYLRELRPQIDKMQGELVEELAGYFRDHPPLATSGS